MYIWVCGRAVPSQYNGMHGSFEFEQAQMLKKRGHRVVYIALSIFPRTILKWKDLGLRRATVEGVDTYNVYLPFGITGIGRKLARDMASQKLFALAKEEVGYPDIIHAHFPSMWSYSSFESMKRAGVEIVVTEHWTEVLKKNINQYMIKNLQWFVRNAKAFICVGEPLKQSVIDLVDLEDADKKIKVIPNIINGNFGLSGRVVDYEHFTFCAVGRLVKCKRFDLLIEAFSEAFKGNERVFLKIVGGGNQMKQLQMIVDSRNMGEQILLTGVRSRSETAVEVQNSDVLVCSSNLETFGVPVIEGMACGKPVITTDVFAMPSIIGKSVGIVIEADNAEQMKAALLKMYRERSEYDEEKIAKIAEENFSESAVVEKLIQIYES